MHYDNEREADIRKLDLAAIRNIYPLVEKHIVPSDKVIKKTHHKYISLETESVILDIVTTIIGVSRAIIADKTRLSLGCVGLCLNQLLHKNIIKRTKSKPSAIGKFSYYLIDDNRMPEDATMAGLNEVLNMIKNNSGIRNPDLLRKLSITQYQLKKKLLTLLNDELIIRAVSEKAGNRVVYCYTVK